MKVFFDTEFIDDRNNLLLLSIGLIREDGKYYYAELQETDRRLAGPWVQDHVLPLMLGPIKSREEICTDLKIFTHGFRPEFWAYFHAFDWVLMCRLFGGLLQVPKHWPHYCNDILSIAQNRLVPLQTTTQHHALNDAVYNKEMYDFLMKDRK